MGIYPNDIKRAHETIHMKHLVLERLQLGKTKYGHGVRVNDDTMTWGTKKDSWMHMAMEEFLDGIIYVIADYIRNGRESQRGMSDLECVYTKDFVKSDDDNELILFILHKIDLIESQKHKYMCQTLINMLSYC